mgnify:CR=1 FL=1
MPDDGDVEEETRVSTISPIFELGHDGESCLVRIYGPEIGRQHKLGSGVVHIGRGAENDLVLDMDNVSRRHARVGPGPDGYVVEDLRSTNGTYVNEVEISARTLHNGDLVQIGGAILKFLQGGNVEAQYHEEIYRMTIVDGLTQIHNRRYFDEFLEREMARCIRYQRALSLVLFDIDHFKHINDTHGHLAGNSVLKRLAELVNQHIRREEAFARYGGEEFVVLMPETPATRARVFAEKIRAMVEDHRFEFEEDVIPVTCSLGVAEVGPEHDSPSALLAAADALLYRAKAEGRNRVVSSVETAH